MISRKSVHHIIAMALKQYLRKIQIKFRVSSYDEHNLSLRQSSLMGAHAQGANATDSATITSDATTFHVCKQQQIASGN